MMADIFKKSNVKKQAKGSFVGRTAMNPKLLNKIQPRKDNLLSP